MRGDRELILSQMPSFGSRLADAMDYRSINGKELTRRLREFGLRPADSYVYDLGLIEQPANPTLYTLAGLRHALQISAEWWFDPTLTAVDLPSLDLTL